MKFGLAISIAVLLVVAIALYAFARYASKSEKPTHKISREVPPRQPDMAPTRTEGSTLYKFLKTISLPGYNTGRWSGANFSRTQKAGSYLQGVEGVIDAQGEFEVNLGKSGDGTNFVQMNENQSGRFWNRVRS